MGIGRRDSGVAAQVTLPCGEPAVGAVRLLGPVEVSNGGRLVPVGGPIARLLLVQLVMAAGRSIPDE